MKRFFCYCPNCGFDTFDTAEEAQKMAQASLAEAADNANSDGWDENIDQLCWGELTEMAVMTNQRPPEPEDCDFDYICEYELTPLEELP
jgi:hypothetical protein